MLKKLIKKLKVKLTKAKNKKQNKLLFFETVLLILFISTLSVFALNFTLWFSFHNSIENSVANSLYLFTKTQAFPVWLLNACFLSALQCLIILLVRKFNTSEVIYVAIIAILCIAEYLKIQDRNEPVLPDDFFLSSNITDMLTFVPLYLIIILLIIIAIIIFICIKLYKYDYKVFNNKWQQLLIIIFVAINGIVFFNRPQAKIDSLFYVVGDNKRYPFDATLDASTNGITVSLANNFISDIFKGNDYVHKNYSKKSIKKITNKYKNVQEEINKTRNVKSFDGQTVIYILSESYTRPVNIPTLKLDKNATPNMDNILNNNLSGKMVSAGYGGGTANMEYMADTSMSYAMFNPQLETPFIQVVPHQDKVPSISDYFKNKIAIHPFIPNYYNRPGVFKQLGYQEFYSQDDLKNLNKIQGSKYNSDESAYNNTLEKINKNNKSQFIELITMQNHAPYSTNEYQHDYKILTPNEDNTQKKAQESYIQGLHYTDESTQSFLDSLNKIKRPITVVFYGDHWPGIYQFMPPVGNQTIQTHLTDYFIFQNDAAKKKNKVHEVNNNKIVAPNEFTSMMLQRNGVKVSPYYALMTKVQQELPPIAQYNRHNNNLRFINGDGPDNKDNNLTTEKQLNKQQLELLHDYELIQYDLTAGKQYSVKDDFYNK